MSTHNWNYFNGTQHGFNSTKGCIPPVPTTLAYCADCGPQHIPNYNANARPGTEHWDTDFKCAPWKVGKPCDGCGKDI